MKMDYASFIKSEVCKSTGKNRASTLRRRSVANSLQHQLDHDIWRSGSRTSSSEHCVVPEQLVHDSVTNIHGRVDELLGFDHASIPTMKGGMVPFVCCKQKHVGLCVEGPG